MIEAIPSNNKHEFYQNKNVRRLVELSLDNLDNEDVFLNIMTLITSRDIKYIKKHNKLFKLKSSQNDILIYDEIFELLEKIYEDQVIFDNLRGTFLELLTHNYLKEKFDKANNYFLSALDCHVVISGNRCERTVDVFALCNQKGFICECKISHTYFEKHDIATLNILYYNSGNVLSPYIITLAPQEFIEKKLIELVQEDSTNAFVHLQDITVISIDNIQKFFLNHNPN